MAWNCPSRYTCTTYITIPITSCHFSLIASDTSLIRSTRPLSVVPCAAMVFQLSAWRAKMGRFFESLEANAIAIGINILSFVGKNTIGGIWTSNLMENSQKNAFHLRRMAPIASICVGWQVYWISHSQRLWIVWHGSWEILRRHIAYRLQNR